MNEIGELLRTTRENTGVSLEEAGSDLGIKTLVLENIENGNIGCFKDIFILKDDLTNYAKYLGLDSKTIIDDFNDYLFEYTSKIPIDDIETAIMEQKKEENKEVKEKIVSPYTNSIRRRGKLWIILYVLIAVIMLFIVIWAVKQITGNTSTNNMVSYIER